MKSKFLILVLLLIAVPLVAADNETCMECHSDNELTTERNGRTFSLYVSEFEFKQSVHGDMECTDCHQDADVDEFPHEEDLQPVFCGNCHDDVQLDFDGSIHGQALNRKEPYAPQCSTCHGKHNILPASHPQSPIYKMQIPVLCGKCHREGAPVANVYDISEHNILENYSQSIHGEGLFKKGLIVTATCTDCHNSHKILPHTYQKSSVSQKNVASTCMRCHSKIEEVHTKIIKGELWESAPGAVPACTDCHLPHKVRKESVTLNISDRSCLKCHENESIGKEVSGTMISLTVKKSKLANSQHRNIPCVKCHADVNPNAERPCVTADKVDCSNCHAKISEEYFASGHGENYLKGNKAVPYCVDCHGDHNVKSHLDETSPIFRSSIPQLCGECHRKGGRAPANAQLAEVNALADYSTSVHGRGLTEKGLLPSAICTDCHTTHNVLKHDNSRSSVYPANIPATCSQCHRGIYKQYTKSVHFALGDDSGKKLPTCSDCHSSHTIVRVEKDKFMMQVTHQCGNCHDQLANTYFDTMHGKAYKLGYMEAAKCSDCHGAHDILPVNDPNSRVGFKNVVETCQKCHEDANMRFTGYLTHATHHDPVKYPILYYTYWAMTSLLIGVFGFFGIHTLLWLPRSVKHMLERKRKKSQNGKRYYIKRFTREQRITHIFVITSFLILALTGMMLKFSSMVWAKWLADLFGGVHNAGLLHRYAAVITFGYFIHHVYTIIREKRKSNKTWFRYIFNGESLMFNMQDVRDFIATIKWFFGAGPRPAYSRWTYWEKFDYFAVFWGVFVIGLSGLIQWFPEYATLILPGWLINVAAIIHSDEALLAVGFIFTIHFFNTHLRPEAFPMDKVIFTGVVPLEEYKLDRPREYEKLKESGELRKRIESKSISPEKEKWVTIFGYTALSVGIILIGLIIYSMMFGYN